MSTKDRKRGERLNLPELNLNVMFLLAILGEQVEVLCYLMCSEVLFNIFNDIFNCSFAFWISLSHFYIGLGFTKPPPFSLTKINIIGMMSNKMV